MRFGLVGPTYTAQSQKFACEAAINLYCEPNESINPAKGGSKMMLVKIPGLSTTHTLPDLPVRCLFTADGIRVFCVSGSTLFELFQDGTFNALGNVGPGNVSGGWPSPAQIFANGTQLFVVSGPQGYIADGVSVTPVFPACMGGYLDTYFLALQGPFPGASKTFYLSDPLNGKNWNPLSFAVVEQTADNIQAIVVDHEQIFFAKQEHSLSFWDSGPTASNLFPMTPVQGSTVEQGTIAPWSAVAIDNTIMMLGGDPRGAAVAWRMRGYTPSRVSNFAIEFMIQQLTAQGINITDCVAYAEQYLGHTFCHFSFPTADLTLSYDCATQLWHQRAAWDSVQGVFHAHPARYHCYAWGKHLVGGGDMTGKVYDQNVAYQDNAGQTLRWLRRCPHISDGSGKKTFFSNLFIDFQVGVGLNTLVDGAGNPRDPVIMSRYSNDGGETYNPEIQIGLGKMGQYWYRARRVMGGSGYDRVEEISGSDPVQIAIVEANMDAQVGLS